MKTLFLTLLFLFAGLIPANFVCAANPLDVVISEIAWMGTETSATDEWIELYNNTTSTIDITGWTLKSNDKSPNIIFSAIIEPKTGGGPASSCFLIQGEGFYLMERTDDDTIIDIPANYIYTGALNNDGETLELRDADGNLIDAIDSEDGWLFGDNVTKQTMERKNFLLAGDANNWQTSAEPNGTPCSSSSRGAQPEPLSLRGAQQGDAAIPPFNSPNEIAARGSSPPRNDENSGTPPQNDNDVNASISFPANIIINEILPSPDGPDSENEWIEIFNQNNFSVDISDWKIADTQGSVKSYTFPQNTIIQAKSFLLLPRPQTKIILNNNGDGLDLIHPDGTITDSVAFTKAKLNHSYNRANSNWVWSDTLTPGWENIIPVATDAEPDPSSPQEIAARGSTPPRNDEKGTPYSLSLRGASPTGRSDAAISVSLLALFSAFSILALKKSLKR